MKERKFRINNPNFAIHPLRLSVRNLPRHVDATKLREALTAHLKTQKFVADEPGLKLEKRKLAEGLVQKVSLVRDAERRAENNERRSKGYGFITFKDHRSAMAALEHLNDNPDIFGGGKRPIVEFAIEDKRKLRMQEELYAKHGHKLLVDKPTGKGEGKGKDGKDKTKGKGEGKGTDGSDLPKRLTKREKKDKKKLGTLSRGQRQRENRRAQKERDNDQAERREVHEAKVQKSREVKHVQKAEDRMTAHKRKKRFEPDAGPAAAKKARSKPGEMSDDFELRAMERFRSGMR